MIFFKNKNVGHNSNKCRRRKARQGYGRGSRCLGSMVDKEEFTFFWIIHTECSRASLQCSSFNGNSLTWLGLDSHLAAFLMHLNLNFPWVESWMRNEMKRKGKICTNFYVLFSSFQLSCSTFFHSTLLFIRQFSKYSVLSSLLNPVQTNQCTSE